MRRAGLSLLIAQFKYAERYSVFRQLNHGRIEVDGSPLQTVIRTFSSSEVWRKCSFLARRYTEQFEVTPRGVIGLF